jgi:hypothetical protein
VSRRARPSLAAARAALFACAALLAACTVEPESSPRVIPAGEIPERVRNPAAGAAAADDAATVEAFVYLVDLSTRTFQPVTRRVPRPLNIDSLLRFLFNATPTEEEEAENLTNLLSRSSGLLEVIIPPETAPDDPVVIRMESLAGPSGDTQGLAAGQVVLTATATAGAAALGREFRFEVAGNLEFVRTPAGTTKPAVTRDDFAPFIRAEDGRPPSS